MSDTNYSDLINEFGSKGTANNKVVTPYADLINEFGSGEVAADHPPIPQTKPGSLFVRQGDTSVKIPPNYVPAAAPMNGIQEYRDQSKLETGPAVTPSTPITQLPVVRQTIDAAKSGNQMAASGLEDISKGMTATGVGKVGLGTLQSVTSPVAGVLREGADLLNPVGGQLGDRAEAVVTTGLPVAKLAKTTVATMPSTRALSTLVEHIGPENIPDVISKLQSNPRLTLADVDPNVQIITQGLAAKPGQPRNILDKFVQGRTDTKLDAVTGAIDKAMGTPVNVLQKVEGLKKQISNVGKEINPVVAATGPVDLSSVISNIDSKLKPGVQTVISAGEPLPLDDIQKSLQGVRNLLTDDKSVRTDAKSLHNFQSGLRAKAEDLMSSANGEDRQRGYALMNIRNQIVDAIDKASPQITQADGTVIGSYKPKLAAYRDVNDIDTAFKKGMEITKNRSGYLEDDPSYWEKWVKEATPVELETAREGARLAYRQQMGSVTNAARKGTDIPLIDFNKEKLKLLFGKEEVETMAKNLADERLMSDNNNKLMQGSMTAMRESGKIATSIRDDYKPNYSALLPVAAEAVNQYMSGGSLPLAMGVGYGYMGARKAITKIGQNLDRSTNVEIANLASATGEARDNLIKALQGHVPQAKLSMKQRLQLALPVQNP